MKNESQKQERKRSHAHRKEASIVKKGKSFSCRNEMFSEKNIPEESRKIIENFDDVISSVRSLSGKQKISLYGTIKNLSHQLTDDRNSRRLGYMNDAAYISAYTNYFMWWNLVRMVRLFSNFPSSAFDVLTKNEKSVAVDIGSGTLTVVIALWLARPELRSKKISWYCLDYSQNALSLGENLYLAVTAKTISEVSDIESELSAWNIIRVKGEFGAKIKEKADFITCGNIFNEILQRNEMPTDFLAKKYTNELLSYLKDGDSSVLLVEPGDPHSARFISLMRNALIRQNFLPVAPCPHSEDCPMAGRTNGKTTNSYGKNAKWCNFAFDTENAPKKLLRLSEKSGLQKERATLSFIFATKNSLSNEKNAQNSESQKMKIRIVSDFIRLPKIHKSGYYACSQFGFLLAVDESHLQPKNGELLSVKIPENLSEKDEKSGAIIIKI